MKGLVNFCCLMHVFFFPPRTFLTAECSLARTVLLVSLHAWDTNDPSHFYTGGSRMCIGEVQAGLFTRGLGVGCSGGGWWLKRGSHWWKRHCLQGCDSQIGRGQGGMLRRHAWPRAWAWRSSGGSGRWWRSGAQGLGLGGLRCGRGASGKLRPHHSNVLQSRRQRCGTADPGGVLGGRVPCSSSRPLELYLCIVLPACVGARLTSRPYVIKGGTMAQGPDKGNKPWWQFCLWCHIFQFLVHGCVWPLCWFRF